MPPETLPKPITLPPFTGLPKKFLVDYRQADSRAKTSSFATALVALDGTGDFDNIQSAIDSLLSSGGIVAIKDGTYEVGENGITIPSTAPNISLVGAGASTIIKPVTGHVEEAILFLKGEFQEVRNIKFDSSAVDDVIGIIVSGNKCLITRCWFVTSNTGGSGVLLSGTENTIVSNNIATDGLYAYRLQNSCTFCVISDNVCKDLKRGILIHTTCNNNIVSGNALDGEGTSDGIEIDANSDNNVISNNRISGFANGIHINNANCDKNILIGNQIIGNSTAVVDSGTNTHPNGASGTTNLALDDLNIIA